MKDQVLQTLRDLRAYARTTGYQVTLFYHEEDSYLMRFANSAVSLHTNEHLVRLDITAHAGRKRASFDLITSLDRPDEMRRGIDQAATMVEHAQALSYEPTVPVYRETFVDETGYDPALAGLSGEEKLRYFDRAVAGLETQDLKLSGIFSRASRQARTTFSLSLFLKCATARAL